MGTNKLFRSIFVFFMAVYFSAPAVKGINAQEAEVAPMLLLLFVDEQSPPTSYTFNGGTLDDLLAVSPTFQFGNLTINGNLSLESGSSSRNITFSVNNFTITAAGSITVDYPTCSSYGHAPDLTIAAVHDVTISGHIDLHGKTGKGESIGADCNSCVGGRTPISFL